MRAVAQDLQKIFFQVRFRRVLANLHPLFYSQIQQSSLNFNTLTSFTRQQQNKQKI